MQHDEIATWFILTLSAEQATLDQDFEHLDALLRRREQLLDKWETTGVSITDKDALQIQSAEERLDTAMRRVRDAVGSEISLLSQRKRAAGSYRSA
jgi:hypothetical protein